MKHEHFDEYKARIKTGLQPMKLLNDSEIKYDWKMEVPSIVSENLKNRYKIYRSCLEQEELGK